MRITNIKVDLIDLIKKIYSSFLTQKIITRQFDHNKDYRTPLFGIIATEYSFSQIWQMSDNIVNDDDDWCFTATFVHMVG